MDSKKFTIIARVNSDFKKQFKKLCKKERRTESDLLRIIIEDKLKENNLL